MITLNKSILIRCSDRPGSRKQMPVAGTNAGNTGKDEGGTLKTQEERVGGVVDRERY